MKTRTMFLSCLMGVIVLFVGYEASSAKSKAEKTVSKVGVVSIRKIFQDCKRSTGYREESAAERNKIEAELEKLARELEAEKIGLRTLKVGSSDYMAQVKEILSRQANLRVQQEFHEQQIALKDQQWTEQLYKDVLQQTSEVAKRKGLDMVFGEDEADFSGVSANELMLTIRTHKLLYSAGCLDITDEVIARLDKEK